MPVVALCYGERARSPPSNSSQLAAALVSGSIPAEYHWNQFEAQNKIAKRIAKATGVDYFSVWEMTSKWPFAGKQADRQDPNGNTGDCMHYCLPGPIDAWTTALAVALVAGSGEGQKNST